MRILVTGATGFIGGHLCRSLIADGHEVTALVRPTSSVVGLEAVGVRIALSNGTATMVDVLCDLQPDGIVHLATLFLAAHTPDDLDRILESNIGFGVRLLEAAVATDVPWFLNAGTFWQHHEGHSYNPTNLYAATKQAFRDLAEYYRETTNITFTTLELNDTYGPGDTRRKLFSVWRDAAETGQALAMSEGRQLIDILHVNDVVAAFGHLIRLLQDDVVVHDGQTYSIAAAEQLSLRELADVYQQAAGVTLNIEWGARPYRPREVMRPVAGGRPLPGWTQSISLTEGIGQLYKRS